MRSETMIPETHKAPLLLAGMRMTSQLESTVAAPRTKDSNDQTWKDLMSGLFQKWNQVKALQGKEGNNPNKSNNGNSSSLNYLHRHGHRYSRHSKGNHQAYHLKQGPDQPLPKCDYCEKVDHTAD